MIERFKFSQAKETETVFANSFTSSTLASLIFTYFVTPPEEIEIEYDFYNKPGYIIARLFGCPKFDDGDIYQVKNYCPVGYYVEFENGDDLKGIPLEQRGFGL
jgi:hypothetical protein